MMIEVSVKRAAILLFCASIVVAQEWEVRSVKIVPGKAQSIEGETAKLRIEGEMLVCDSHNERIWYVALDAIQDLTHDTRIRNRAAAYLEEGSTCQGEGCAGDLVLAAVLAPFKVQWEYLTIGWREDKAYRAKVVRLRRSDLPSFAGEMRSRTGLIVEDGAQELKDLWREIERRQAEALSLRIDKRTLLRQAPLAAGPYLALILEGEAGSGTLFLFRGNRIDPRKPAMEIPVSITASKDAVQGLVPEYSIERGWRTLNAVRVSGRRARIVQ